MERDEKATCGISRAEAVSLLEKHLPHDSLHKHSFATEAIMRALAEKLGYDPEMWGMAGLLHDLDYSETKDRMDLHGLVTEDLLRKRGVAEEITEAIKGHNADNLGFARRSVFEHALTCAECITGIIVATALVYPNKRLAGVKPKSILKRMKQKEFARNVNREYIRECETIGVPLDDFAVLSLKAMQGISDVLGL